MKNRNFVAMIFSSPIRKQIEQSFGSALRYPGDIEGLVEDIQFKTGERVSLNTLKRLWGFIGPEVEPRSSTLDIIARYLGSNDWPDYQSRISGIGNSDFEENKQLIDAAVMPAGTQVCFGYHPDRLVTLKCLGKGVFEVTESINSKLLPTDVISVMGFCEGYPLNVASVMRDGVELGPFVAGKIAGLRNIQVILPE